MLHGRRLDSGVVIRLLVGFVPTGLAVSREVGAEVVRL